MTDFLLYILITSAWIWGIHALFQDGHILEFIANWWYDDITPPNTPELKEVDRRAKEFIAKPIFDCPVCMSSAHGLLWFFIGLPLCFHDALPIRQLIPFLICLCGFNYILVKLTSKERKIIEE